MSTNVAIIAEPISTQNRRVSWDKNLQDQVEEARADFENNAALKNVMTDESGNMLDEFNPDMGSFKVLGQLASLPTQALLQILDESGDQRLIWDADNKAEIARAAKKFAEYLEKGWKPYAITVNGKRGKRIHSFDPEREEIVFDDRTTKQKLSEFVKSFKTIRMLPKTFPG